MASFRRILLLLAVVLVMGATASSAIAGAPGGCGGTASMLSA